MYRLAGHRYSSPCGGKLVVIEHGEIRLEPPFPEIEIQNLLEALFDDPRGYQFEGLKE
jgi:hypothetical protein